MENIIQLLKNKNITLPSDTISLISKDRKSVVLGKSVDLGGGGMI